MICLRHSVGTGLSAALVIACLAAPGTANAANPIAEILCETTPSLHEKLTTRMRSQRAATGLRGPEQIVEVWTDKTGAWTLVMTYATGMSCIVAMGENWSESPGLGPA